MQEARMRRLHRYWGIILAPFLAGQAISGGLLALGGLIGPIPYFHQWMAVSHYAWDPWGSIYRVLLGLVILFQGITGALIFIKMRARRAKAQGFSP
jgi:succinate dehydrogenase/fumarate reductase cytochrome b subunit